METQDLDALRREFDAWADTYERDVEQGLGVLEGYRESRLKAIRLVQVREGMQVADIGIGTGALAELLAARGARITGIDLSPRMLGICQDRHPDWRLLEGDFLHLPLSAGEVDLAATSFAFHHLSDRERVDAIRECLRVVRPGGEFLLIDIMFSDSSHRNAARERLGAYWDEENYATFGALRRVGQRLGLNVRCRTLSALHGAAVFSKRQPM